MLSVIARHDPYSSAMRGALLKELLGSARLTPTLRIAEARCTVRTTSWWPLRRFLLGQHVALRHIRSLFHSPLLRSSIL